MLLSDLLAAHTEARYLSLSPGGRLSLCSSHRLVMIPNLDPDLENVIQQALADAQAAGRDHMVQTMLAVQAVQQARPDMTASDALDAVHLVQRK